MTRYNTTEILNQITNRLPDNSAGAVTPAVLRAVLTDMVMSLRAAGAYLAGIAGVTHSFVNAAFQVVPGLYSTSQSRDPTEIGVDTALGQFTALFESDYTFAGSFSVDGPSAEFLIAGVAIDGAVGTYFRSQVQMDGTGNKVELSIDGVVRMSVGQKAEVMFSAPSAPATISISNAALTFTLNPSRV